MNLPTGPMDILFYIFGALAILTALIVVNGRNPISSAFSLVLMFFCVAATYVLQQAHLIGTLQILVYAGAIMVLFVFVIMLLNADLKNVDLDKHKAFRGGAALLCIGLLGTFIWALRHGSISSNRFGLTPEKIESLGGNTQVLSQLMFSDYILPFELTSILLLVGIVGSVALAKRKMENQK